MHLFQFQSTVAEMVLRKGWGKGLHLFNQKFILDLDPFSDLLQLFKQTISGEQAGPVMTIICNCIS